MKTTVKKMPKYPCRGCIYFKACGDNSRTHPCEGRQTKSQKKTLSSVDDVVHHLLNGLNKTKGDYDKCKRWLTEYQAANQMTLKELDKFCRKNSAWVLENVFE